MNEYQHKVGNVFYILTSVLCAMHDCVLCMAHQYIHCVHSTRLGLGMEHTIYECINGYLLFYITHVQLKWLINIGYRGWDEQITV